MKVFKIIPGLLFFLLLFSACEKELMKYEGTEGIYFGVQWGPVHLDSTQWPYQSFSTVNFINIPGDETEIKLRVMATGRPKDYDRSFALRINQDSSTAILGENYEAPAANFIIKAGEMYTDIPIKLLRSDNILEEIKTLGLNLMPSKDFDIAIPTWYYLAPYYKSERKETFDASFHMIEMNGAITKPAVWWGASNAGKEGGLWGEFTVKKFLLMCELMDLIYDDFGSASTMPNARRDVVNQVMRAHLQEQYDNKMPVLESDGRLMWVSGVSWTSTIGVPYNP